MTKKSYHIELRVRNNFLLSKMAEIGIKTVVELSRFSGVSYGVVWGMLTLKAPAIDAKTGDVRDSVVRVAQAFGCRPEDIYPPEHFGIPLRENKASFTASIDEIAAISSWRLNAAENPEEALIRQEATTKVRDALAMLTPRERFVIENRILADEPLTLAECGRRLGGITGPRVAQLEWKGLRKMKDPAKGLEKIFRTLIR